VILNNASPKTKDRSLKLQCNEGRGNNLTTKKKRLTFGNGGEEGSLRKKWLPLTLHREKRTSRGAPRKEPLVFHKLGRRRRRTSSCKKDQTLSHKGKGGLSQGIEGKEKEQTKGGTRSNHRIKEETCGPHAFILAMQAKE